MTAEQLLQVAATVYREHPQAVIERNEVGNLAVIDRGDYVGWVDVVSGELTYLEDM